MTKKIIGYVYLACSVALIALRATGYVDWNWWWVLAPVWAPMLLFTLFAVIVLFIIAVAIFTGKADDML